MRAVQITRFGGPEVLDVVDLPDPVPGDGQQLFDVSTAGVNYADTHQRQWMQVGTLYRDLTVGVTGPAGSPGSIRPCHAAGQAS
jgi:NADPH:quinone reductase-like Zn-dependent oxidoreductase